MTDRHPLPRPGSLGLIQYAGVDMIEYAAAVSAAKDAEIAQLRQYLDTAQRRAAALGDEAAGLREDAERWRYAKSIARQNTAHDYYGNGGLWTIGFHSDDNRLSPDAAIDAARKGEVTTPPPSPSPRS